MEKTFDILTQQFRPMLVCYLRTISGDSHLAEDLAQETFLAAHKSLNKFETDGNFGAWLRGIARNKFLQHRRSAARKKVVVDSRIVDGMEEVFTIFDQPTQQTSHWNDQLDSLKQCVAELSESLRAAVDFAYEQGLSLAESAARSGSTVAAMGQRLSRARSMIRECIQRRLAGERKQS